MKEGIALKKEAADEFLVEKKSTSTTPEFGQLPVPGENQI